MLVVKILSGATLALSAGGMVAITNVKHHSILMPIGTFALLGALAMCVWIVIRAYRVSRQN